jgi:two-component system nitrate/nitrite response regulator NarL
MHARFLIIDDNALVRSTLGTILQTNPDWEICGEASNGADGVESFKKLRSDVVIVDFQMPGLNGVETARLILQVATAVPILMFTDHASAELENYALGAGIRAVVSKIDTFLLVGIIKAILGPDDSTPRDEVSSASI